MFQMTLLGPKFYATLILVLRLTVMTVHLTNGTEEYCTID
jgi:hypothetical protein